MVDDVASAAYWAYRERFLFDKGGEIRPVVIDAEVDKSGVAEDDAIDVIGILESEGVTIDNGGPITEG